MVKHFTRTKLGVFVFVTAWTPFLACNLLQIGGPTGNTNDNCADPTANPAVFVDPDDATFCTSDVRDVDDEIVRFDTITKAIIWAADGTAYNEGDWTVDGVLLAGGEIQVRFGTKEGERRAYFTETGNGFICQIQVIGASLHISGTSTPVPQE